MAKATRKKKEKAADFSKAKLKLGKGKKLPTNQIDTSFKARSIALPSQSIASQKDDAAPTTKRKLTFDDLIAHLKHYSPGTRRDALLGLRELLEFHPSLIEPSLTTLFGACVRLIGDEEASVRKALLSFFSWILPLIPKSNLTPHTPMLLLFTTSAQTHIFPEIEIDAVRFLDLFLDIVPAVVVEGWRDGKGGHGRRVLEGYLSILSAGTKFGEDGDTGPVKATSTASVVLSTASKRVVLQSLSKFIRVAIAQDSNSEASTSQPGIPTWYFAPAFSSPEAFQTFDALLRPRSENPNPLRQWKSQVESEAGVDGDIFIADLTADIEPQPCWSLQNISDITALTTTEEKSYTVYDIKLARTLHPVLLSAFLDCAPAVFSPSSAPPDPELGVVIAVTDIYRNIYSALFQRPEVRIASTVGPALEDLQTILGHMTIHFPFQPNGVNKRDVKLEQAFEGLNLAVCELTSLVSLASKNKTATIPVKRSRREQALPVQISRVSEYVVRLLAGEPSTSFALLRHIFAQTYAALLPTLWALLSGNGPNAEADPETSSEVLYATLEHAMRASSTSAVKRSTVEFIARLVLLETDVTYAGGFTLAKSAGDTEKFEQWVLHMPKTLWEMGGNNIPTSETILYFLLRLFQRRSSLTTSKLADQLVTRLIPFFTTTHPSRGDVPGPFSKINSVALRRLALAVAVTLCALSADDTRARLDAAVGKVLRGTEQEQYWKEIKRTL
ncbi:hypothetical protein OF83DRAFT_1061342 [Amylostereum chailletii]|nr:hypothetical protein OF83DRAFT_1061342 [Amylostereum chailletii]